MLILRLLPFIYAVTALRGASDVTCFDRGNPIEAKCSSIFGLRTTVLENYCLIMDPQRTVRNEDLPALRTTGMPPISDTAALQRRGFTHSATVYVGDYTCQPGWILVGTKCFYTIQEQLTFEEAKKKAEEMGDGISLPSFHSDADTSAISYFLQFGKGISPNSIGPVWTGSFYEETWKNLDGSEADFFRWAPMTSKTDQPSAQVMLPRRFDATTGSYIGYFSARPQSEKYVAVFVADPNHANQPPKRPSCTYESLACVNDKKLNCLTIPLFYVFSATLRLYAFDTDMQCITNFAKHYGTKLPREFTNTSDPAGIATLPHILPANIIDWVNKGLPERTPKNPAIIDECPSITTLNVHRSRFPRVITQLVLEGNKPLSYTPPLLVDKKTIGACSTKQNECGATLPLYEVIMKKDLPTNLNFFYTTSEATLNEVQKNPDYDMATKRVICYVWPGLVEF